MKKTVLILSMSLLLSSCSLLKNSWISVNPRNVINPAMELLSSAINEKDASAVKDLFSSFVTEEVDDFDESVVDLLNYVTSPIIDNDRVSISGESASLGTSQPNSRFFPNCRYDLNTIEGDYKVLFSYYSYYSDVKDVPNLLKIGFYDFSIIRASDDRPGAYDRYTGNPQYSPGISIGFLTSYYHNEFATSVAVSDNGETFEPVILNTTTQIQAFRNEKSDDFSLDARSDGYGFDDVSAYYDDEFFLECSLLVFARFDDNPLHVVQCWLLYVGEFVYFDFNEYIAEPDSEFYGPQSVTKGSIMFIELPTKVANDIDVSYSN